MTPPTDGAVTFNTEALVTLGRIEEKVSHLTGLEERMRSVETSITELKANQRPKVPWWVIAGGIAGILAVLVNGWFLFNLLSDFAAKAN